MTDILWVRDVTMRDFPDLKDARTGDRLPDGSILLRLRDMQSMGLRKTRSWLLEQVLQQRTTFAIMEDGELRHLDEEVASI